jgi:hypothetical protein
MTFDIAWYSLRIAFWLLGLAVVIHVIRPGTLQSHMRPPGVVPAFKFRAEERQVVKTPDEGNALQPLILESLDDAFCDSDSPVFPYGSQAGFDIPLFQ